MGFNSSIDFRLTGEGPGIVRVSELGRLAGLAFSLGLVIRRDPTPGHNKLSRASLKFGESYASDIEPMTEWVARNPQIPRALSPVTMPTDLEVKFFNADELAAALERDERSVYRGYMSLGGLSQELANAMTIPATENERYFCPGDIGFSIDPWAEVNERGDDKVALGFLKLSISGHGYFFPQTAKTYIDILVDHPGIRELTDFIRVLWPQEAIAPPDELIEIRRDWMKSNWIHPLDDPLGWHWIGYNDV